MGDGNDNGYLLMDDLSEEGRPTHSLKEGIQIEDLNKGVELEFDPEADLMYHVDSEKAYRESAELFDNLRFKLIDTYDKLSPFETLKAEMEPLEGYPMIYKKVIIPGYGPVIPSNSLVTFHVNLYKEFDDEPFDSTRLRGKPIKLILGKNRVLPGVELGILSMKKDETATFILEPEMAFGKLGVPPRIPENAGIFAEIEVLDFTECKTEIDFEAMDPASRKKAPYQVFEQVAETYKNFGNNYMKRAKYFLALQKYIQAARLLESYIFKTEEEKRKVNAQLLKIFLNISFANIKLEEPIKALSFANKALEIDKTNVKCLYRCGKAHQMLSEFGKARKCFEKAIQIEPHNPDLLAAIQALLKKEAGVLAMERKMFKNMFQK